MLVVCIHPPPPQAMAPLRSSVALQSAANRTPCGVSVALAQLNRPLLHAIPQEPRRCVTLRVPLQVTFREASPLVNGADVSTVYEAFQIHNPATGGTGAYAVRTETGDFWGFNNRLDGCDNVQPFVVAFEPPTVAFGADLGREGEWLIAFVDSNGEVCRA